MVDEAVRRLRDVYAKEKRDIYFRIFEAYDLSDDREASYGTLADELGVKETDVTNFLAHARRRFRACVDEVLRHSVADDGALRRERARLFEG